MALALAVVVALSSCSSKAQSEDGTTQVKAPQTDIFMAIMMNNLGVIKQHIEYGTNLNQKDPFGSTPLITAIAFGKTEAAKLLIDGGSDLSVKNNDGSTALHVAAFFCHTEIVEALLAKGANKDIKNNWNATALQSVQVPWEEILPAYEQMQNSMKPMGLNMDLDRIQKTRPAIIELLN